jgi:uroporphyrinogen-III synthase
MRPLVILRPEPGASATAEAARAMGLQPLVMPLFRTEAIPWQAPNPFRFDALLLTSANTIRGGGTELERVRSLRAHCVGEATAAAAREAGFAVASSGSGGVEGLLRSLPPGLRLLHLGGADRQEPSRDRQEITSIDVYRAVELPAPEALAEIDGSVVALHSARAAARFGRLSDDLGLSRGSLALVAMSERSAAAAGDGWERVDVAPEPADSALLAIAARLCNKPA